VPDTARYGSAIRSASPKELQNSQEVNVADNFRSSREVIIRTNSWEEACHFYKSVLGLPISYSDKTMVGFETGAFCLYVERGAEHGPVFEFLVPDVPAAKTRLTAAGCTVQEENASVPRCYIRDPYGVVFNIAPAVK
jgi:predicted enzyme related to lactoylglutathione lyase